MMKRMNRVFLIAVATLFVSGCASHREQRGYARQPELKSGKSARSSNRQQKTPEAPRILPETNYAAGRVFEQQGSPEKAIEQYRKAVAVNHEYTAAYARLGLILSITGQHEEAVAALTRAVELKPGSAVLRNNLGFELLYVERWDEAERHLREAARLDSKLSQAHINLGLLLGRTQRDEQAIESFRKVLPEPDAYYNLGLLQRAQGRHTQAAESFRHVLTINPEFTAAQRQLVLVERKIAAADAATRTVATNAAIVPDHGAQDTRPAIEVIDRPASSTTTSAPFVDLGALIKELITEPMTEDIAPLATQPVTKASEPAKIEIEQTARPETIVAGTSVPDAVIEPTKPVEYFEEDDAPRVEPSAGAIPTPTTIAQEPQPLRWDLTLADMARVLNITDNQQRCLDELQTLTMELGPLPAPQETMDDPIVGPPAASVDEVVLVLAVNETRINPLSTKLETPAITAAPVRQQSLQMMNDMEISLQILRNEIQCQKENGAGTTENLHQPHFEQMLPVNDNPATPQTVDPNQRTQLWQTEFETLDNLLAVVRNESACVQDTTVVQNGPVTHRHDKALDQLVPAYYYGPGLYAPPTTTPHRARWDGKDSNRAR